jgi:hypothetical protein
MQGRRAGNTQAQPKWHMPIRVAKDEKVVDQGVKVMTLSYGLAC